MLEVLLHRQRVLTFETGLGEMAPPDHFDNEPLAWALTGAWNPDEALDGRQIERWLRGLRPQNGARAAQEARARKILDRHHIRRTAPDQADIIWATPHMEYPGAVGFRSLFTDGTPLEWERAPAHPLAASDLEALLDQVIEEMRRGTTDPRVLDLRPTSPSGSLPKFAVHRSPLDRHWYLPDTERLSTHIVKHEDRADVPAEAAIESICQRTLAILGLRAATTYATVIGDRQVVVSERTDREVVPNDGRVHPIHQEEWASACGRDPDELIQRAGTGGGWVQLHEFLTARSEDPRSEQQHLWQTIAAIVLLGHRDIHRRNVGVRYPDPDEPRKAELAPLYDVASMHGQKSRKWRSLGLPVGDEEAIDNVGEDEWIRMAKACRTDPAEVLALVSDTARRLPAAIDKAIEDARDEDEWRDANAAEARIEALREGVGRRTRNELRPTRHPQRMPEEPEWIDAVIEAVEDERHVGFEANESDRSLGIMVEQPDGTKRRVGTARSPRVFYEALCRAGVLEADQIPELEKTLERDRVAARTRAM